MKITKIAKKLETLATNVRIEGSKKCDEQREELEVAFLDRIRKLKGAPVLQAK